MPEKDKKKLIERQAGFLKVLQDCGGNITAARALCGDYPAGLVFGWAADSQLFSDLLRLLQGLAVFDWPMIEQRFMVLCQRAESGGNEVAAVFRQALAGQADIPVKQIMEDVI